MTSRGRAYWLVAAVGLVGLTVVGILNSPRPGRAVGEFDWGERIQPAGSAVLNRVAVAVPFDEDRRRFAYYTGGHSSGSGEPSAAPDRIIAEAVHGDVTVRMRAFDSYSRQQTIALESREAEQLLARCRESAANPMLLGFRLTEMRARIAATTEGRTAGD